MDPGENQSESSDSGYYGCLIQRRCGCVAEGPSKAKDCFGPISVITNSQDHLASHFVWCGIVGYTTRNVMGGLAFAYCQRGANLA